MHIPTSPWITRRCLLRSAAIGATAGLPRLAHAQAAFPVKPLRLVVPYPPGGGADIVARLVAQKMSTSLGHQVIVDNKPGASTIIGTDIVAKAVPDGHTFGMISDSHAISPAFFPKLPYDTLRDFAFVSQLASVPLVMVAHPTLNVKTLPEFIALARSRPGQINYASTGSGTPHQLAMEWLRSLAGIQLTHVPFKGAAPALADVVGGSVQVMFSSTASAAPYVRDGRLVALGVSSAKRLTAFPGVPSLAEAGLPQFDFMAWYGTIAPAGTPREIVHRLSREIGSALALAEVKERLEGMGLEPAPSSPEHFEAFVRRESVSLAKMVKLTGVKPE